jgi:hypothetical protein
MQLLSDVAPQNGVDWKKICDLRGLLFAINAALVGGGNGRTLAVLGA